MSVLLFTAGPRPPAQNRCPGTFVSERLRQRTSASGAVDGAETRRGSQGTRSPGLSLLIHPGLRSCLWPAQSQKCAKFGVLGVNCSLCMSWLVPWCCRQISFPIYQTGHMGVRWPRVRCQRDRVACGEGWAHNRC